MMQGGRVHGLRGLWQARPSGWQQLRRLAAAGILGTTLALSSAIWGIGGEVSVARAETVHVIRAGESLAGIARQYEVAPAVLAAYNNIDDPNLIVIGQQLTIPPQSASPANAISTIDQPLPGNDGYHTVVAGDSLNKIAVRYAIDLGDLLRLNGLADANTIWIGQELRLTARVEPADSSQRAAPGVADDIYVVQPGDTLALIARQHATTIEQLMRVNGLPNSGFVYAGQRLRIQTPPAPVTGNLFGVAGAPVDGRRWIEISLSKQTLTAWQGDVAVLETSVSTGKASTPTVTGDFQIYAKYDSQHMTGDDYDLPGVPWVMYFYRDFAIHGAYWHSNFGYATSHGCVNMRIPEAEALYAWAAEGTEVVVSD
jgi:LysM repeat protein